MKLFLIGSVLLCSSIAFVTGLPVDNDSIGDDDAEGDTPPEEQYKNPLAKTSSPILNSSAPWEMTGLYEGDIYMVPSDHVRNGLRDPQKRWINGTVPYKIDKSFNEEKRGVIKRAMKEYHQKTCIRFRPYKQGDKHWIIIKSNQPGCFSLVGMHQGGQVVNLEIQTPTKGGCVFHGTVIHELMHAIGFFHQQSATDRDKYIDLHLENVEEAKKSNFNKYSNDIITDFGFGYDFDSVMHYSGNAFSKNGRATMTPKPKYGKIQLGRGYLNGLSPKDVGKINAMYKDQCRR